MRRPTWKSRASLMVVSVRRARFSLKYCLTWECLKTGVDAVGDHAGPVTEPGWRGSPGQALGEEQRDDAGLPDRRALRPHHSAEEGGRLGVHEHCGGM